MTTHEKQQPKFQKISGDTTGATTTNKQNVLFSTFNNLFDVQTMVNNGDKGDRGGLYGSRSLNYSLKTCLFLKDSKWVLCMLDINNLK